MNSKTDRLHAKTNNIILIALKVIAVSASVIIRMVRSNKRNYKIIRPAPVHIYQRYIWIRINILNCLF